MQRVEGFANEEVRPILRREYDALVVQGAFADERLELLRGVIVRMSPVGADHASVVERLTEIFIQRLVPRATVRIQSPFAASDDSEPEPDVAVVPRESYRKEHPTRAWLIIEVAHSSLARDRGLKAKLYAESGVEEYWVVNLVDDVILVHTETASGAYGRIVTHRRGELLRPVRFPDLEVAASDILG